MAQIKQMRSAIKANCVNFPKLCVPLEDLLDTETAASGSPQGLSAAVQSSNPHNEVKLNHVPPFLQNFVFLVLAYMWIHAQIRWVIQVN